MCNKLVMRKYAGNVGNTPAAGEADDDDGRVLTSVNFNNPNITDANL